MFYFCEQQRLLLSNTENRLNVKYNKNILWLHISSKTRFIFCYIIMIKFISDLFYLFSFCNICLFIFLCWCLKFLFLFYNKDLDLPFKDFNIFLLIIYNF